ncbi:MAG: hypothetical protein ACXABY_12905, partial [Candidatus Thorarchaeota archaeon]
MKGFKSFVMKRKIFTLVLGFVLLGALFAPIMEYDVSDGMEVEDAQPDASIEDLINPEPTRNAVLSALFKTVMLTNNSFNDYSPQIDAGQITWQGYDGSDWEVFLFDGASITQLTDNSFDDSSPQIDAGQVTWRGFDSLDNEIFFYNGTSTTQLTDNSFDDSSPQIDAGQVTWRGFDGSDDEIFFYNGTSTTQLTDNSFDDSSPQIHAGQVTWNGYDGSDYEIFLFDGASTSQLTVNSFEDSSPQIDAGHVTWRGSDGSDEEIFLFDGTSTTQLTDNAFDDFMAEIDAGRVTWHGHEGSADAEIFYYLNADAPDTPTNPQVHQRILHNYLTWDEPNDNGANISRYNIFRGQVENGTKTNIGNSTTTSYNDSAVIVDTMYYYVVTAENIIGESAPSLEVSGMPRDTPFLEWRSPAEGEEVILPIGDAVFDFLYDWGIVDDVELVINGTSYGSVWDMNSTILSPYTADIDGKIEAVLNGYIGAVLFVSDSRNFTFSKLTVEVMEQLDAGDEYLGQQLYMILHDPNGDRSYSGFRRQTGLSLGVGASIAFSYGKEEGWMLPVAGFPGVEAGYSTKLEYKLSTKFDFRYEIKDTVGLTSNKFWTDSDYMGPGFGDTYWREAWGIHWTSKAFYREYYNGSKKYENPLLFYQITRSHEVLLNDYNAPEEWRARNPVHNDWAGVDWIDYRTVDGGNEYSYTQEVTSSLKTRVELQIKFTAEAEAKLGLSKIAMTFGIDFQTYFESEIKETYATSYSIWDDDSDDHLDFEYGIDRAFGTPVFRPTLACKTSFPLEHNTIDYLPPVIQFPTVEYDTSLDGLAPSKDDQPFIMADIFDEGGIQLALIRFSINGGTNWDSVNMTEQVDNPGTWQGSIPAMNHGMIVLWYIQVWDLQGLHSTRMNPNGLPYQYTVINRAPRIEILSPNGAESFVDTVRITWS